MMGAVVLIGGFILYLGVKGRLPVYIALATGSPPKTVPTVPTAPNSVSNIVASMTGATGVQ